MCCACMHTQAVLREIATRLVEQHPASIRRQGVEFCTQLVRPAARVDDHLKGDVLYDSALDAGIRQQYKKSLGRYIGTS
jgi:hypothetical protein